MVGFAVKCATVFAYGEVNKGFALIQFWQVDGHFTFAVGDQSFDFELHATQGFTFGTHVSSNGVIIEVGEPQFVLNDKAVMATFNGADFHRCNDLFVLFETWARGLIWVNQTIHTEVVVVWVVAVIAAVFVELLTVFITR